MVVHTACPSFAGYKMSNPRSRRLANGFHTRGSTLLLDSKSEQINLNGLHLHVFFALPNWDGFERFLHSSGDGRVVLVDRGFLVDAGFLVDRGFLEAQKLGGRCCLRDHGISDCGEYTVRRRDRSILVCIGESFTCIHLGANEMFSSR